MSNLKKISIDGTEIEVDGAKTKVIPRDVQLDPVRDTPIHVDFHRIGSH